jgi:hypothetical protein
LAIRLVDGAGLGAVVRGEFGQDCFHMVGGGSGADAQLVAGDEKCRPGAPAGAAMAVYGDAAGSRRPKWANLPIRRVESRIHTTN